MANPYKVVERKYLSADKKHTRGPVYHPAIKLPGDRSFSFFPDDTTESGAVEYDNPHDALVYAIMQYKHYMGKEGDEA